MLTVLLNIMKFLPSIIQAVIAVEGAIGAGKGETKKQLVLAAVDAAAKVGETVDQKTVAGISTTVDNVVNVLNTSGFFSHGTAAPPK